MSYAFVIHTSMHYWDWLIKINIEYIIKETKLIFLHHTNTFLVLMHYCIKSNIILGYYSDNTQKENRIEKVIKTMIKQTITNKLWPKKKNYNKQTKKITYIWHVL